VKVGSYSSRHDSSPISPALGIEPRDGYTGGYTGVQRDGMGHVFN